jgi:hypothetical protein
MNAKKKGAANRLPLPSFWAYGRPLGTHQDGVDPSKVAWQPAQQK